MKKTHNPIALYEALQTIRLTASVLYDRGSSLERSQEQLADDIKPLIAQKQALIQRAVQHDLGGVICAVKQLQADSKAHLEAAQFLKEKAENAQSHARELLDSIRDNLNKHKSTEMQHGDFSATLVDGELNIR